MQQVVQYFQGPEKSILTGPFRLVDFHLWVSATYEEALEGWKFEVQKKRISLNFAFFFFHLSPLFKSVKLSRLSHIVYGPEYFTTDLQQLYQNSIVSLPIFYYRWKELFIHTLCLVGDSWSFINAAKYSLHFAEIWSDNLAFSFGFFKDRFIIQLLKVPSNQKTEETSVHILFNSKLIKPKNSKMRAKIEKCALSKYTEGK